MGSPSFFAGSFVKFLKASLNLDGKAYILTGTNDPSSVATSAPSGSIFLRGASSAPSTISAGLGDVLYSGITQGNPFVTDLYGSTFTASVTGGVTSVGFDLTKNVFGSGGVYCSIYATSGGIPTTLLASSASVNVTGIATGVRLTQSFTFSSPPVLTAGVQYACIINFTGVAFGTFTIYLATSAVPGLDSVIFVTNTTWASSINGANTPFAFFVTQNSTTPSGLYSKRDNGSSTNWTGPLLGGNTNLVPTVDNTYSVGTTALRWSSLHVGPGSVTVHNDTTNTNWIAMNYTGSVPRLQTQAGTLLHNAGPFNIFLGIGSTNTSITGQRNSVVGVNAGLSMDTGQDNTIVGMSAGSNITGATDNTLMGSQAGNQVTTSQNTIIGSFAGRNVAGGGPNTMVGYRAGFTTTAGNNNVFVGDVAGNQSTGNNNTLVGSGAGSGLSTGASNTYLGSATGSGITTGSNNTILGAAVGGLAAGLTGNIILANGTGAIKAQFDATNWNIAGGMNPTADNSFDLGTTALRWASVHVGPGSLVVHNDNTNTNWAKVKFSSAVAQLVTDAATPLQLTTGANVGLYIDTAGRVGIGTTSFSNAATKLQVSSGSDVRFVLENTVNGNASFWLRTNGTDQFVFNGNSTATDATTLTSTPFRLGTSNTVALTIDTSQRVGIGTESPGTTLEVKAGTAGITINQTAASQPAFIKYQRNTVNKWETGVNDGGPGSTDGLYFFNYTTGGYAAGVDNASNWLFNGNVNPSTDNTRALGTTALRWASLHVGPGSVTVHNDTTNTLFMKMSFVSTTATLSTNSTTPLNMTVGTKSGINVGTAGTVGIGTAGDTQIGLVLALISGELTGVFQYGFDVQSSYTGSTAGSSFSSRPNIIAATTHYRHLWINSAGSSSNATNQYGTYLEDLTGSTNNYGVFSSISSGANKWFLYGNGTAKSYFTGDIVAIRNVATSWPSSQGDAGTILRNDGSGNLSWVVSSWTVSVKTTTYQALVNDEIYANTSGGAFTITLPITPTAGQRVKIADYSGNWATNNVTVARNGQNINGSATNFILNVNNTWAEFVFVDATQGWRVRS